MEENKNGQGFWVESNFEPNPNYQPKRKKKAKGGLGKLFKRGCLILIIGAVVIIALLWGLGLCMGTDDDGHQVKAVADSTIVESEPVAEPEPVEVAVPESEPEKPKVTSQQNPEPKAVKQNKSVRKRSKTTETPPTTTTKKKGYGFRLERVDHIPTKDNP